MKKTINILLTSTFALGIATVLAIPSKTIMVDAMSKNDWSVVGTTPAVVDVTDGVQINGSAWGARAYTNEMLELDQLSFDMTVTNVASGDVAGFFFSNNPMRYMPQDGASVNGLTFAINTSSLFYSGGQNRFAIFPTHDLATVNPQSYTSMDLQSPDGYGFSDGTCVMNSHEVQKLSFKFEKVNSDWYKVSMTEGTPGTIWTTVGMKNLSNGTIYNYVKASQIEMNSGKAHLIVFGFNGEGKAAPLINITNLQVKKGDTEPPVINLTKTQIDTFAGLYPDEAYTATDNKDGIVPIKYDYPAGMLDSEGKLCEGNFDVILTATDKSGNVATKTLKYFVNEAVDTKIAHKVSLNADGVEVTLNDTVAYEGKKVWFQVKGIESVSEVSISVKDSSGSAVTYSGNNPFYFVMGKKDVTIDVTLLDDTKETKTLDIFNEDYVYYLGRHYRKNGGMFFSYSNSGFVVDFVTLSDTNKMSVNLESNQSFTQAVTSQWAEVSIDGNRFARLEIPQGTNKVTLFENIGAGVHSLEFKKMNEAQYTNIVLKSFELSGIRVKKHVETRKLIEFYGDSISCGYGNLATGTGFQLATEDSTQAYTNLTAKAIGYRSSSIAFSGIGIYRSWTHSPIIATTLYKQLDGIEYNLRKDPVSIAVINLGTNDNQEYSQTAAADKPAFVQGMKANLKQMMNTILTYNPDCKIIIAYDMMTILSNDIVNGYTQAMNETKSMWGTNHVYMLKFDQNASGADGHPNLQGHQNAANKLVEFIQSNNLI